MLVQTIVLSRPYQQPLQICSVHGSDVALGPCGYPIIDDGCDSAVGLVSESAAELIIIIMSIIATITIIISSVIAVIADIIISVAIIIISISIIIIGIFIIIVVIVVEVFCM
jgi:hypothetical protein